MQFGLVGSTQGTREAVLPLVGRLSKEARSLLRRAAHLDVKQQVLARECRLLRAARELRGGVRAFGIELGRGHELEYTPAACAKPRRTAGAGHGSRAVQSLGRPGAQSTVTKRDVRAQQQVLTCTGTRRRSPAFAPMRPSTRPGMNLSMTMTCRHGCRRRTQRVCRPHSSRSEASGARGADRSRRSAGTC